MSKRQSEGFARWCAAGIFLGAFLLFQVQPIISKMILPWFGGSPAVWTTCMLFFQTLLLAGYAYAHGLARFVSPSRQALLHSVLLLAALATLPVAPGAIWKPPDGQSPAARILWLLLANVGITYFLLAATSPLVQSWFARVYGDRSPYRLYALSNIGSLGALLTYPFVFERLMRTSTQGVFWSAWFVVFAGVSIWLAWRMSRESQPAILAKSTPPGPQSSTGVGWPMVTCWTLLAALGSMLLLAVTNHLCQDVAVVPLLWIAPLSLYLLTFIICFDRPSWYVRRWWGLGAMAAIAAAAFVMLGGYVDRWLAEMGFPWRLSRAADRVYLQTGIYLSLLFLSCMVCHGELVRSKPVPARLTGFYLAIATGGALGGLFVALIAPQIFSAFFELNLGLVACFAVAATVFYVDARQSWFRQMRLLRAVSIVALGVISAVVVWAQVESRDTYGIAFARNFYGVLKVKDHYTDDPEQHGRAIYHGQILHGYQFLSDEKRRQPTTYFVPASGIGRTLQTLAERESLHVGVVGLGAGTLAAYGRPGDRYRFYEINPLVIEFCEQYFTFVSGCPADVTIVSGDARLSLEREAAAGRLPPLDVLALDAFSGDSIPVHLLTREAFAIYLQRVRDDGVIAMHISNRYVDLVPVVVELARHYKLEYAIVDDRDSAGLADTMSTWMLLVRDATMLRREPIAEASRIPPPHAQFPLWTDQYNNLIEILR